MKLSDDEANAFESKVLDLLDKVYNSTQVAMNVLVELQNAAERRHFTLTFVPPPLDSVHGIRQAEADAMDSLAAADRDDPAHRSRRERAGVGSSVVIYLKADSDELVSRILVHEMVHAIRDMYGIWNPIVLPAPLTDFDDEEEFFAMVVGNVNLSELGRDWDLRGSHKDFKRLEAKHWNSYQFLGPDDFGKAARRLMAKLQHQMPGFFYTMARMTPPWLFHNPFRKFAENP
jgi:hypothetical protein